MNYFKIYSLYLQICVYLTKNNLIIWRRYMKTGVYKSIKKDGSIYYRSSVTFHSKHISLGSFDSEEEAHSAYLDATGIINSESIYTPDDYPDANCRSLSFNKWVVLNNFKNNGIYIKTPIYLKKKYFNYYISEHDILIFDADDLFYYSEHTIMRRGSHLFVTEYGMQVNIASRYGIRNFARPGIDFRFVNGNDKDFRYSNIEVLNTYQGVTIERYKNSMHYTARIHINGNFTIGRYDTIEKAAIAYNKAADLLEKKGIVKKFERNYIEEMTAKEYIDIYDSLNIADKIVNYIG